MTSFSSNPKKLFSLKNASVSFLVGPLVITNQVILAPFPPASWSATCCSLLILSAWYWNSVFPLGNPMSKHPFGADDPSLVP
jgi:hypothetical protein